MIAGRASAELQGTFRPEAINATIFESLRTRHPKTRNHPQIPNTIAAPGGGDNGAVAYPRDSQKKSSSKEAALLILIGVPIKDSRYIP